MHISISYCRDVGTVTFAVSISYRTIIKPCGTVSADPLLRYFAECNLKDQCYDAK